MYTMFKRKINNTRILTLLTNNAFPTNNVSALKAKAFSKPIFKAAAAIIAPIPLFFFLRPSKDLFGINENSKFKPPSLLPPPDITKSASSNICKRMINKLITKNQTVYVLNST